MSDYRKYFDEPQVNRVDHENLTTIKYKISISKIGDMQIFLYREIWTEEKKYPKQLIEDAKQSLIKEAMIRINLQEA